MRACGSRVMAVGVGLGLSACGFSAPGEALDGAPPGDGATVDGDDGRPPIDAPVDAPDGPPADAAPSVCVQRWLGGGVPSFGPPTPLAGGDGGSDRDPYVGRTTGQLYWVSDRTTGGDVYRGDPVVGIDNFDNFAAVTSLDTSADESKFSMDRSELYGVIARRSGQLDLVTVKRSSTTGEWSLAADHAVDDLNTSTSQFDPELRSDALELFWAEVPSGNMRQATYHATRTNRAVPFTGKTVVFADTTAQQTVNYADPALSEDGLVLLVATTLPHSDNGGGMTATDTEIYFATRPDLAAPFGGLQRVLVGSTSSDGDAALSRDGCKIYFSSNRSGNYELYVATMVAL